MGIARSDLPAWFFCRMGFTVVDRLSNTREVVAWLSAAGSEWSPTKSAMPLGTSLRPLVFLVDGNLRIVHRS